MEFENGIPCLDFSKNPRDLEEGSEGWKNLCKQVREACEEYGCFEVVYDKVPVQLHEAMFRALKELFDLPVETKKKNWTSSTHGYVGRFVPSLYETLRIPDAHCLHQVQAFANLMWPDNNPAFCQTLNRIGKMTQELEQIIRKMVFESLRVEKYFDSNIEDSETFLRVTKYKSSLPATNEDSTVGLGAHSDNNILTILYQDDQGLEVLSKQGEWLQLAQRPATFTVLVGEALKAWSNGRLKTGEHRVMMKGEKERYSYGLFSTPKMETVVQVPEELVDKDHPVLYLPYKHKDFLRFYYNFGQDNSVQNFIATVLMNNNNNNIVNN